MNSTRPRSANRRHGYILWLCILLSLAWFLLDGSSTTWAQAPTPEAPAGEVATDTVITETQRTAPPPVFAFLLGGGRPERSLLLSLLRTPVILVGGALALSMFLAALILALLPLPVWYRVMGLTVPRKETAPAAAELPVEAVFRPAEDEIPADASHVRVVEAQPAQTGTPTVSEKSPPSPAGEANAGATAPPSQAPQAPQTQDQGAPSASSEGPATSEGSNQGTSDTAAQGTSQAGPPAEQQQAGEGQAAQQTNQATGPGQGQEAPQANGGSKQEATTNTPANPSSSKPQQDASSSNTAQQPSPQEQEGSLQDMLGGGNENGEDIDDTVKDILSSVFGEEEESDPQLEFLASHLEDVDIDELRRLVDEIAARMRRQASRVR